MQSSQGSTIQIIGCLSIGQEILFYEHSVALLLGTGTRALGIGPSPECTHNM
jgi:hypothetical protein